MIGTVCLGMAVWIGFVSPLSQVEGRFWKSGSLGPFVVLFDLVVFLLFLWTLACYKFTFVVSFTPGMVLHLRSLGASVIDQFQRSKTLGLAGEQL
jgi:hypothetical protein